MRRPPALWDERTESERMVALEVLRHGPLSRSELARRLGLSPASLTRLVAPMLDGGVMEELDGGGGGQGRPTRPLRIVAEAADFVGVRLTPDAAHGIVATLRADVVAAAELTLDDTTPDGTVSSVAALADRLRRDRPATPLCLGVSLGGLVTEHAVVRSAPFFGWREPVPLAAELRRATGLATVVDNDVMALTRSQSWFGLGRGLDRFALITLGAGIGLGVVVHGELLESADTGLGLAQHLPLGMSGSVCPLGHHGCAQAMLSSEAIAMRTSVALRRPVAYEEALGLAVAGQPAARTIVTDSARALGRLVTLVADVSTCHDLILTGEGVRLAEVARTALDDQIRHDRDPASVPLRLQVCDLSRSEWARGPAVLALQASVRPPVDNA